MRYLWPLALALLLAPSPALAGTGKVKYTLPCFEAIDCDSASADSVFDVQVAALLGWTVGQWPPDTLAQRVYWEIPPGVGGMMYEDWLAMIAPSRCRRDSLEFDDRGLPWQLVLVLRDDAGNWTCWSNVVSRGWPVGVAEGMSIRLQLSVAPVPADRMTIAMLTTGGGPARIDAYDVTGRRMISIDRTLAPGPQVVPIITAGWPDGIYFARVQAGPQVATRRFVVVH